MGALALLLAGIVGNVTDRMRLGFVVDFIDVQFGGWHYPTFNVADAAICVGAGLLVIDMFLSKKTRAAHNGEPVKTNASDVS
jgi:signal peptidase II